MMLTLKEQEEKIENVRINLHALVIEKAGNMIDHEVGALSAELDKLIVEYQKIKRSNDKRA